MFSIDWSIEEADWGSAEADTKPHAAGSDYDNHCIAHTILFGLVDIRDDGRHLLDGGDHSMSVSIPDLAYHLSRLADSFGAAPPLEFLVEFMDDDLRLSFSEIESGRVRITCNLQPTAELVVSKEDFRQGCERFLRDFGAALQGRLPHLVGWKSFGVKTWAQIAP